VDHLIIYLFISSFIAICKSHYVKNVKSEGLICGSPDNLFIHFFIHCNLQITLCQECQIRGTDLWIAPFISFTIWCKPESLCTKIM